MDGQAGEALQLASGLRLAHAATTIKIDNKRAEHKQSKENQTNRDLRRDRQAKRGKAGAVIAVTKAVICLPSFSFIRFLRLVLCSQNVTALWKDNSKSSGDCRLARPLDHLSGKHVIVTFNSLGLGYQQAPPWLLAAAGRPRLFVIAHHPRAVQHAEPDENIN